MKKHVILVLLLVFLMAIPSIVMAELTDETAEATMVGLVVDGVEIETRYVGGTTFVPLRKTAYAFGFAVEWDADMAIITISRQTEDSAHTTSIPIPTGSPQMADYIFIEDDISWISLNVMMDFVQMFYMTAHLEEPEIAEISRTDTWRLENFAQIRASGLPTDSPHGDIAMAHILFMNDNLYSRSPFTYREKETAAWIVEELLAMGHSWDYIYVQEFTFGEVMNIGMSSGPWGWIGVESEHMLGDGRLRESQLSQNVILTIPGQSERKIIVGAHYDSLPYPGASDNASGTALLLESAQRMVGQDNYHTIVYVFFGAEEVGLHGAWFYYYSLTYDERDNIVKMINADILFEGPYFLYGAGVADMPDTDEALMELLIAFLELQGIDAEEFVPEGAHYSDFVSRVNLIMIGYAMGMVHALPNEISAQVDEIAAQVMYLYDVRLIGLTELVFGSSDQLVFVFGGHTVVTLFGLEHVENIENPEMVFFDEFTTRFLHSSRDCFHYIEENFPGMMADAMRTYSLFLEAMLLAVFE